MTLTADEKPFALWDRKAEFNAALIQLAVKQGLPDHDELLTRVREAGDELFKAGLNHETKTGFRQRVMRTEAACERK